MKHKTETLGRYCLDPVKSRSGVLGEVLFGRDPELDRPVAIKRLGDIDAARREARALAACGPLHMDVKPANVLVLSGMTLR